MIHLGKIFQNLVAPLPVFLILLFLSSILIDRNRKLAKRLFLSTFAFFLFFSSPFTSCFLAFQLERGFPSKPYELYPRSEVIVTLGGTVSPKPGKMQLPEESGGSRLVPTFLLYRAGKGGKIIVSGGNPYQSEDGSQRTEADDMADFLIGLGVPSEDIIRESVSRNTEENAIEVGKILNQYGWKKPLLITSAFHMKRALLFFNRQKVVATPVAVAYVAKPDSRFWYTRLIPSAKALELSSLTIKEHLGYLWGQIK